jgi:hypothetical protein
MNIITITITPMTMPAITPESSLDSLSVWACDVLRFVVGLVEGLLLVFVVGLVEGLLLVFVVGLVEGMLLVFVVGLVEGMLLVFVASVVVLFCSGKSTSHAVARLFIM